MSGALCANGWPHEPKQDSKKILFNFLIWGPPIGATALLIGMTVFLLIGSLISGESILKPQEPLWTQVTAYFTAAVGVVLNVPFIALFSYIFGLIPAFVSAVLISLHCWRFAGLKLYHVWFYVVLALFFCIFSIFLMNGFNEKYYYDDLTFACTFLLFPSLVSATFIYLKLLGDLSFKRLPETQTAQQQVGR